MNVKINPSEYKVLIVDDVISNVLLLKVLLNNRQQRYGGFGAGEERKTGSCAVGCHDAGHQWI